MSLRRSRGCLAAVLLLAACEDAPTVPSSYAQRVAGETWVAVAHPAGLPVVEGWLPYASTPAATEARALRAAASRARGSGRIAEALALERRALLTAAAGVERAPPEAGLWEAAEALDAWVASASERLGAGDHPALAVSVAAVAARRDSARAALGAGNAPEAVLHLAHGALDAREHGPVAVGARLLDALDARLEAAAHPRARRLGAGAREGLATGDTVRALRRVVYAHQLLDAAGVSPPR